MRMAMFIYQPHIHRRGRVVTPDILLRQCSVWRGRQPCGAVSVNRVSTRVLQDFVPGATVLMPALAMIAGQTTAYVTPAYLIVEERLAGLDLALALRASEVVLTRFAWRADEVRERAVAVSLAQGRAAVGIDMPARTEPPLARGELRLLLGDRELPAATGHLDVAARCGDLPQIETRYECGALPQALAS